MFTDPVEVTFGRPCYDRNKGYKINIKQGLADFFSKTFPSPIETTLVKDPQSRSLDNNLFENAVQVGTSDECRLLISFMRTLRIPEDNKEYHLPPGYGAFPLFPTERFSSKLSPELVAQGGILLPMYRKCAHGRTLTYIRADI